MLFDYVAPKLQSGRMGTVWSRFPLQPMAPGVLTPFSYSVLVELASRAWYLYYDRLGFDPTPRSQVIRRHKGHLFFNLSLCAKLEADNAGVEPLPLQINGERHLLAAWEKPGFLASFKLGRAQKKVDDTWIDIAHQMGAITEKARTWYLKTQGIKRWGQAEVLQIMEEIERVGVESMMALLAARLNLAQRYARLVADFGGSVSTERALLLINNALGDLSGLIESSMLEALSPVVQVAREEQLSASLKNVDAAELQRLAADGESPSAALHMAVKGFLDAFGHRTVCEGEIANRRWSEDAGLLFYAVLTQIDQPHSAPTKSSANALQTLLNALPSSARKQGEQSIMQIRELHKLQSNALHALAYIWAGTRNWALAAGREAMVDKRLHSTEEVFLFELEEIKQMMTGEWNISSLDEIREMVEKRQLEFADGRNQVAPEILIGDDEAFAARQGFPLVAGKASGPLDLWNGTAAYEGRSPIVAVKYLDSAYALAIPNAAGFVAAAGTPCDPFVVAAQPWQRPVAVAIGKRYDDFGTISGEPTTLNVNEDGVAISISELKR